MQCDQEGHVVPRSCGEEPSPRIDVQGKGETAIASERAASVLGMPGRRHLAGQGDVFRARRVHAKAGIPFWTATRFEVLSPPGFDRNFELRTTVDVTVTGWPVGEILLCLGICIDPSFSDATP